ncbi:MAG: major capsid protein [Microvirus sp.]|nr:MAG: major capsid protein [Microvirus sp.]
MAMHRNRSVDVHQFAMVPRSDIPRASFDMQHTHKLTFNSGLLVPVFLAEVLPGDTFNFEMTGFARMATPLKPLMDNLYLDTFSFYVPNRLAWTNWVRFMGEQNSPADSISFSIPQIVSPVGGYAVGSVYDYFGLPTVGQVGGGNTVTNSALPNRMYGLICHHWFRDENLQNSLLPALGDGPDPNTDYVLFRRGKRHDYFTSCLPFLQKGTAVPLPLGTTAPVVVNTPLTTIKFQTVAGVSVGQLNATAGTGAGVFSSAPGATAGVTFGSVAGDSQLHADLTAATAATINQIRQSFQIQKLLERDARGGTRYTEIVRSHFGVTSPDARLQRPEYLGGSVSPVGINPIAQTSATAITGSTTPVGELAAMGQVVAHAGWSHSFVEHGYVMTLASVRADLTYQQGMARHWSRLTRYDFYFPVFAMLGEQSVLNKEIYSDGSANDALVFGYQERWAEMRYMPSRLSGLFRSTSAGTLDVWHLAQKFASLPVLNTTFIQDTPPISRVIAVPSQPEFLADFFFKIKAARPMPMYSVPGLVDHF